MNQLPSRRLNGLVSDEPFVLLIPEDNEDLIFHESLQIDLGAQLASIPGYPNIKQQDAEAAAAFVMLQAGVSGYILDYPHKHGTDCHF